MKKIKTAAGLLVLFFVLHAGSLMAEENVIPAPPEGNLRYSITVTKFNNEAGWHGKWNIGDGFKTIMTNLLHETGWFIVLGDDEMRKAAMGEQDLVASGRTATGKKAAKIGRMTPAQLLVRGSITHVQDSTGSGGGGFSFKGVSLGGSKGQAEINVTMYLVDSETGQVKASTDVVGKSNRKGFKIGYSGWTPLGGVGTSFGGEKQDNMGKAVEDAVGQGIQFLIQQLESIPWEGSVILVKNGQVIINRGEREGVAVGRRFKVGSVEQLVDPDSGEVLDSSMTQVGVLQVTSVKEKVSYCAPVSGGESIQKGMTIFIE